MSLHLHQPGRILMTADTVGGVWIYACELVKGLCSRGIEVVLATMGSSSEAWQLDMIRNVHGLTVHEGLFKLEWMPDSADDVKKAGVWLLELENQYQPDLVHLNNFAHACIGFSCPVLVVGHSCLTSWWSAVHGCDLPPAYETYRVMVRKALQSADMVVAPTRAMLKSLDLHYGPFECGCVIPNGRSAPAVSLQNKEEIIFSVGRLWDKAKNTAILESIAPDLPWPVYVAGPYNHPDGYSVEFSNTRCLGSLPATEVELWYSRASIYVLPALYEPFGLSALEAGLAGCALVLGDIDSLRELWSDAAIFVSPHDPQQLKRELIHLINNPSLCDQLALCAYHRAQTYTPFNMTEKYIQAYSRLLENRYVLA